jgi:hypothetical protein
MELSNLLSTMVQGAETETLAQIRGGSQAGANAFAQANGQAGVKVTGQSALTLAAQPPELNVTGQSTSGAAAGQSGLTVGGQPDLAGGQPGLTLTLTSPPGLTGGQPGLTVTLSNPPGLTGAQTGLSLTGQTGPSAGGQGGLSFPGQPGPTVAVEAGGLSLTGQRGMGTAQPGPSAGATGEAGSGVGFQPIALSGAGQAGPADPRTGLPALLQRTGSPGPGAAADVYYGSEAPASPSLLSQSGVGAYIQLLNALAGHEATDRSANLVTNNLGTASATLKSAYAAAVATLPAQLQQKDWGFSVSNGTLVFTQGKDALSAQDRADLQKAFAGANVEFSAREVAAAMSVIAQRRQMGADPGSLAWGGIETDDGNPAEVGNLRTYVTTSAPGSNYHPNSPDPAALALVPNLLGGMDLRDLVTARPNFFHADGSVITETPDEEDATPTAEDTGTLQGTCSCGHVRFTVENTFEYAFFCHCSRCRIRTGSAFAAVAGIGIDKVQVTAGSDDLLIEGDCADGYGARCSHCHVFLFAAVRERKYMHVSLGVLDGTPNRLPDHHIYVRSKAPWFDITDTLPQYDELP